MAMPAARPSLTLPREREPRAHLYPDSPASPSKTLPRILVTSPWRYNASQRPQVPPDLIQRLRDPDVDRRIEALDTIVETFDLYTTSPVLTRSPPRITEIFKDLSPDTEERPAVSEPEPEPEPEPQSPPQESTVEERSSEPSWDLDEPLLPPIYPPPPPYHPDASSSTSTQPLRDNEASPAAATSHDEPTAISPEDDPSSTPPVGPLPTTAPAEDLAEKPTVNETSEPPSQTEDEPAVELSPSAQSPATGQDTAVPPNDSAPAEEAKADAAPSDEEHAADPAAVDHSAETSEPPAHVDDVELAAAAPNPSTSAEDATAAGSNGGSDAVETPTLPATSAPAPNLASIQDVTTAGSTGSQAPAPAVAPVTVATENVEEDAATTESKAQAPSPVVVVTENEDTGQRQHHAKEDVTSTELQEPAPESIVDATKDQNTASAESQAHAPAPPPAVVATETENATTDDATAQSQTLAPAPAGNASESENAANDGDIPAASEDPNPAATAVKVTKPVEPESTSTEEVTSAHAEATSSPPINSGGDPPAEPPINLEKATDESHKATETRQEPASDSTTTPPGTSTHEPPEPDQTTGTHDAAPSLAPQAEGSGNGTAPAETNPGPVTSVEQEHGDDSRVLPSGENPIHSDANLTGPDPASAAPPTRQSAPLTASERAADAGQGMDADPASTTPAPEVGPSGGTTTDEVARTSSAEVLTSTVDPNAAEMKPPSTLQPSGPHAQPSEAPGTGEDAESSAAQNSLSGSGDTCLGAVSQGPAADKEARKLAKKAREAERKYLEAAAKAKAEKEEEEKEKEKRREKPKKGKSNETGKKHSAGAKGAEKSTREKVAGGGGNAESNGATSVPDGTVNIHEGTTSTQTIASGPGDSSPKTVPAGKAARKKRKARRKGQEEAGDVEGEQEGEEDKQKAQELERGGGSNAKEGEERKVVEAVDGNEGRAESNDPNPVSPGSIDEPQDTVPTEAADEAASRAVKQDDERERLDWGRTAEEEKEQAGEEEAARKAQESRNEALGESREEEGGGDTSSRAAKEQGQNIDQLTQQAHGMPTTDNLGTSKTVGDERREENASERDKVTTTAVKGTDKWTWFPEEDTTEGAQVDTSQKDKAAAGADAVPGVVPASADRVLDTRGIGALDTQGPPMSSSRPAKELQSSAVHEVNPNVADAPTPSTGNGTTSAEASASTLPLRAAVQPSSFDEQTAGLESRPSLKAQPSNLDETFDTFVRRPFSSKSVPSSPSQKEPLSSLPSIPNWPTRSSWFTSSFPRVAHRRRASDIPLLVELPVPFIAQNAAVRDLLPRLSMESWDTTSPLETAVLSPISLTARPSDQDGDVHDTAATAASDRSAARDKWQHLLVEQSDIRQQHGLSSTSNQMQAIGREQHDASGGNQSDLVAVASTHGAELSHHRAQDSDSDFEIVEAPAASETKEDGSGGRSLPPSESPEQSGSGSAPPQRHDSLTMPQHDALLKKYQELESKNADQEMRIKAQDERISHLESQLAHLRDALQMLMQNDPSNPLQTAAVAPPAPSRKRK